MTKRQQRHWAAWATSLVLAATTASAATFTWTGSGTTNNWSDAFNWSGGIAPANDGTADIVFGGSTRLNPTLDMAYSVRTLKFASGSSAFTLGNSGTTLLMTGTGSDDANVLDNPTGSVQTVNFNIQLNGGGAYAATSSDLIINGTTTLNNVGFRLKAYNGKAIYVNGVIAGTPASGSHIVAFNGDDTGNSATYLNALNTYTHATNIWRNTIYIGVSDTATGGAFGNSTGDVIFGNSGLSAPVKILMNGAYTLGRTIRAMSPNAGKTFNGTLGGATADASSFAGPIYLGQNSKDAVGMTLTAATGGTVTFSGNFLLATGALNTANSTINKTGLGTVVLAGTNNTYLGTTTVTQGTLRVDGTLVSGGAAVNVNSGATLGGNGTINRSVTVNGILAPGASIGTLTTGSVTFASGSQFAVELGSAISDKLIVGGNLDIANGSLVLSGTPSGASSFVIATYSGTLTGPFASVSGLPTGASLDYGTGSNSQITLLIPEPASVGLLGLGGLMMVCRRK